MASLCLIQYTKARPHKKIGKTREQLSHYQVDVRWTSGWGQHSNNILDFIFLSALTWQDPNCYGETSKDLFLATTYFCTWALLSLCPTCVHVMSFMFLGPLRFATLPVRVLNATNKQNIREVWKQGYILAL